MFQIKTFDPSLVDDVVTVINTYVRGWPYTRPVDRRLIDHWIETGIHEPQHMLLAYRDGEPHGFLHGSIDRREYSINLLAAIPGSAETAGVLLEHAEAQARERGARLIHGPDWSSRRYYGGYILGSEMYHPSFETQTTEAFVTRGYRISLTAVLMAKSRNTPTPVFDMPSGYFLEEATVEDDFGGEPFRLIAVRDAEEAASCTARLFPSLSDSEGFPVGYINYVATTPGHRRNGLAKSLVSASLVKFTEMGAGEILIGAAMDNFPALSVYEATGFRRRYNINGWSKEIGDAHLSFREDKDCGADHDVTSDSLSACLPEMEEHLVHGILPFWRDRGWDDEYGGYHTTYDGQGRFVDESQRFLYTHCRQLWWFAHAYRTQPKDERNRRLVELGLDYLLREFGRGQPGTWHWKRQRSGGPIDSDCVLYGYSFAIYALSECYLALDDDLALQAACDTFDFIQTYFADGAHGGYYEFLNADFTRTRSSDRWCDRKSLDGHLHLLEAYTNLVVAAGTDIHRRRLSEIASIVANRMVDEKSGSGWNQLDFAFTPVAPITIHKMWDPKARGAELTGPADLTSYGHNAEAAWLLFRASECMEESPRRYMPVIQGLLEHTLRHAVDWECGGVYRYGLFTGPPTVDDKDFWPQAECMVGFIEAYRLFGRREYLDAFLNIWNFIKRHMIVDGVGEWRSLLDRRGKTIDGNTGQIWKDGYHTGRSLSECSRIVRQIVNQGERQ